MEQSIKMEIDDGDSPVVASTSRALPDEEDPLQTEEKDILNSSSFGPNAKVFSCALCEQKFTNKLKIVVHWAVNHAYKLCAMCPHFAFRYDSEKIQHERQHLPFGCSSNCGHEFTSVIHDVISDHYKKTHHSCLCNFCSSVIEPYEMFKEHIQKKHFATSYFEGILSKGALFELIGNHDTGLFHCKMCNKKKSTKNLFGHYVFYHNLSIHALRDLLESFPNIRINGSSLNGAENDLAEAACETEVCNVCDKKINEDSTVHEVFCQGYVMCKQKQCGKLLESNQAHQAHLDLEHPSNDCKFGCTETNMKATDVEKHLESLHDIVECSLCNIINSSGNLKNHLRDKHSVNLMTYEKAISQTSSKLYRVERSGKKKRQVLCNFCDSDITTAIREFSFVNHYHDQHEIHITALLRMLDKNPIMDMILNDKKQQKDEECLKNFKVVVESSTDELVEVDFDTSWVYAVGSDRHLELKPMITSEGASLISCEFCNKNTFEASCRLYEHMNESHGFRLLNVSDQCDTCHVSIHLPGASAEDNKSFNLSLVCPLDESRHVTKDSFSRHMSLEHSGDQAFLMDNIIYKCFECNFAYNKIDDIRVHFKSRHPDIKTSFCRICRIKLAGPKDKAHFEMHHAEEVKKVEAFQCKFCDKRFAKKKLAMTHFEKAHMQKEVAKKFAFKCQLNGCAEAFESKEDRKMHHMIAHPDVKMFSCKSCSLKFATKSSLSSHNLIHKNEANVCSFCSKTFIRRDSYKEHLLIHSGVRQKCSFCDKSFVQRSNLVRHERIHLNDKPYKCTFCEKTFSDKGACNSHEKVHTKSESSNCEVCGRHFARKQKLKYHMRIHTLENVLTCVCGKIFTESYSFRKHKETHLKKARSDQCDKCGKTFKSVKAKEEHMFVHGIHKEESLIETKIQCTLCNLNNLTMDTIQEHLRSAHDIMETDDWETYIGDVEFELESVQPKQEAV